MKSFLIATFSIALLSGLIQFFIPWWIIAVVAFAVGFVVKQNGFASFLSGFFGVFFLWVLYAFIQSTANDNLLAHKVAALLQALTLNSLIMLYILTGFIGGLVAGFAALSGRMAARIRG